MNNINSNYELIRSGAKNRIKTLTDDSGNSF